jgi:aspartyl-tRNA(Asn)/glutamyl-tRNA(Gln) amidotransferase subunit A
MVFMAMGSDTGGSIRIPAAFCGTVGLKPTFGRVSRYGVMPLDFSLDHMGPLTRSVRDAALTLQALAGFDPRDETSSQRPVGSYVPELSCGIPNLRIGWPENFYFDRVDPALTAGMENMAAAAKRAGAQLTPVRIPDIAAMNAVARLILMSEASSLMEPFLDRRGMFGSDVLALFDQGRLISATDYINAQRLRRLMQREFRAVWEAVDCLFTPTAPMGAPKIGESTVQMGGETEDVRLASTRLVRAINLLGLPALSLPCGLDQKGCRSAPRLSASRSRKRQFCVSERRWKTALSITSCGQDSYNGQAKAYPQRRGEFHALKVLFHLGPDSLVVVGCDPGASLLFSFKADHQAVGHTASQLQQRN